MKTLTLRLTLGRTTLIGFKLVFAIIPFAIATL